MRFVLLLLLLTSCTADLNARRMKFEKKLQGLVGKPTHEVTYLFGRPTEYINVSEAMGDNTYMMYKDINKDHSLPCDLRFSIDNKTQLIKDWDYKGNGCYYYFY